MSWYPQPQIYSTIFRTITDEVTGANKSIGLFGKSFTELKGILSSVKTNGLFKTSIISDTDIQCIKDYNTLIEGGASHLEAMEQSTKGASSATAQMIKNANGNTIALNKMTLGAKAASVAMKVLSVAGNMLAMWAISEAITFVVKGIDNLANSAEHCKERVDELVGDFESGNNTIQQHSETISKIASRYSELSHGVNELGGNVSLTNEEYAEYQDICNQIADMYPTLVKSYDEQGNAILKLKGNVEGLTQALLDEKKANAAKIIESDEIMENYQNTREHGVFDSIGDYFSNFFDSQDELTADMISEQEKVQKYKDFLQMSYEDIKSLTTKIGNDRETIIQRGLLSKLGIDSDTTKEEFATFRTDLEAEIVTIQSGIDQALSSVKKKAGAYLLYNEDYSSLSENEISVISSLLNNIDEDTANSFGNDDKNIAVYVNKIVSLIHNAKPEVQKAINDWFILGEDVDISTKISALDAIIKTYEDNGIVVPIYFETQKKELNTLQEQYSDAIEKAKKQETDFDWDSWFKENSINTQEEIDRWNKIAESATNAADARKKYTEGEEVNKTAISSQKTFDEVWNSIGEGDDDAGKKAQEAKEKVLELAEAGKLTEKAFENSSIADTFTQAGYSIEKATKKVNSMVDSAKQLSSLKSSISSIQNAYQEKKDNKVVGADTLANMEQIFGKLKSWDNYKAVLGSTTSKLSECREAQNQLATEYVNSNNFLSQLTDKNKDYYISQLSELGIANAKSVVEKTASANKEVLKNKTEALAAATSDLSGKTNNASEEFLKEANMSNLAKVQLADLIAKEQIFNGQGINTTAKVAELNRLASAYFGVANAIQISSAMGSDPRYYKKPEDYSKAVQKQWSKLVNKQTKLSVEPIKVNPVKNTKNTGSKGSKDSKDSAKKSKQVIDWIERRLKNLQSTIDYTSSKLQNLFTVESKNSNLDKQIKTTTKLINEYGIAAEKYQQKANKVAKASTKTVKGKKGKKKKVKTKGLSKDVISKIKTGKLTKKTKLSSLIKEYGEDTANKIQSYIDYYDKAQEAKKNKQDQIAKKRELQVQKQTNIQEEADKKTALYQTKRELAQLKDKNGWIKKEIDSTKESYNAQIKVAEIQKDTVEKDKLIVEQKKALLALYQEEVDNIKSTYDERKKILESGVINNNGTRRTYGEQYYKNQVDLTESRGLTLNASWYKEQNKIERDKIAENEKERQELIAELSKFSEGTTEWYNLQSDIADCDNSIIEAKKAINENSSSIRELKNSIDEKIGEFLNSSSDELDFISGLLYGEETDKDKGILTDAGNLRAITDGLKIAFGESGANEFGKQLSTLEKLYSSNASMKQWEDAGFDGYFNDDGTLNTKAVEDKIKSLRSEVQSYINMQINGEKELIELGKQKYEAQKSYLQDIIDVKKEALSVEKD